MTSPSGAAVTAVAYSDTARGQAPNCPAVRWFIHRATTGDLSGFFFYTDASGVSQATGKFDPATGQFHMTVANLDGNGPVGTATGAAEVRMACSMDNSQGLAAPM